MGSEVLVLGRYENEATCHLHSRLKLTINTAGSSTVCLLYRHRVLSATLACFLRTRRTRNEDKKIRVQAQPKKLFISDR